MLVGGRRVAAALGTEFDAMATIGIRRTHEPLVGLLERAEAVEPVREREGFRVAQ